MIKLRWRKPQVQLFCAPCQAQVSVPVSKTQLFVCIEDGWHTAVFVCPKCKCKRSIDTDKAQSMRLQSQGLPLTPWSVQRQFSPQVTAVGAHYTPRRVPRTWLPFDEVDVVHLINDMNTCDWFSLLAAYNPHVN